MTSNFGKRIFGLLLASLFAVVCSPAQQPATGQTITADRGKNSILIVYLSRTKNTEAVARMIHGFTGGRMVAVELEIPYPDNYRAIVQQVDRENETDFLPPLKTKIEEIGKYQTVFVGFPTWDMTLPPPMKSFLSSHDLKGKTVVPFNTHAGYGAGSGFEKVRELCPKSRVLEGFSTKGGVERDGVLFAMEGKKADETRKEIREWLRKIGMPMSR
ncbi:MAG TPA: flavodoxin [Chthoniobacterales bacterium]|nr:flavodoxin [Chthoniobacterales bacterium]